jgi:hypothetical protein
MLRLQRPPFRVLVGAAALLLALGAGVARADVLIDDFSHVDTSYGNPWPLLLIDSEAVDAFESVAAGVIQGTYGRVRESSISTPSFDAPGEDWIEMTVETTTGTFDHQATAGASSFVSFSYGYRIVNDLHADFSAELGLRIDLADLQLEPGGSEYLRIMAFIFDRSQGLSKSPYVYVPKPGPRCVFLPFADFDVAETFDLTAVMALGVELYATTGTSYSIERLFAGGAAPGDANADGLVNMPDLMAVLLNWGECVGCPADFDGDASVGVTDLLLVLANWT